MTTSTAPPQHDARERREAHPGFAIEASGLVKAFGATRAVDGLDLSVPGGCVYGVLGPNGAGKTTAIRMLTTLVQPDEGHARVFGHDTVREARAVRRRISLTGQFASIDEELTGTENLVLLARLLGYPPRAAKRRTDELLEAFGLTEAAGRLVRTYSGGMRRRIDVAASIIVTPDLLFLDEPTTGLDPRSRNDVWEIVRALVAEGRTVLLTTQYLDEADQLADRIAVIDHGRAIAEGTPDDLKVSIGSGILRIHLSDPSRRADAERLLAGMFAGSTRPDPDPAALSISVSSARRAFEALAQLTEGGIEVSAFNLGQPSLDEVFLALTGRPTSDTSEENAR